MILKLNLPSSWYDIFSFSTYDISLHTTLRQTLSGTFMGKISVHPVRDQNIKFLN